MMKTQKQRVLALYTAFDRLIDDRIVYHWGQGNQAGMVQRLGIIFVPGLPLVTAALQHRWRR